MKNSWKRWSAVLTGLLFGLCLLLMQQQTVQAAASDFVIVNGILIQYKGTDSVVTVPSGVTVVGDWVFFDNRNITKVVLPDGVRAIGEEAFAGCVKLTSITIPETLTSIGEDAFCDCKLLKSIKLPAEMNAIGDQAFAGCTSLTSITIPQGVTEIGEDTFFNCKALTTVSIPNSVNHICRWAFGNCTALKTITYHGTPAQWDLISIAGLGEIQSSYYLAQATRNYSYVMIGNVPYTDLEPNAWYVSGVQHVVTRDYMTGTSTGIFSPQRGLTRGQLATILWRMEGRPRLNTESPSFTDVPKTHTFYTAIEWAKKKNLVSGYSDGSFKPSRVVTRQEYVVILRAYAKYLGLNIAVLDSAAYKVCSDYTKVSTYARGAMQWGYNLGLVGTSGSLTPREPVTRAQAAAILMRFDNYYKR